MYTTQDFINAEVEYRTSRIRQSWGDRRRREESQDAKPGRFLPGQRTRTTR